MISATVDMSVFNQRMTALREALIGQGQEGDALNLMRDEARRLNAQIVKFIPPLGPGGSNSGARAAGEHAIESELKSLFTEAHQDLIDEVGSQFGTSNIDTWRTEKDGSKLHLDWKHLDPTGARIAEYHELYRRKSGSGRGKVPKQKTRWRSGQGWEWSARAVIPEGTLAPYIATVKARVGRMRASWAKSGVMLGVKAPGWISRHFASVESIAVYDLSGLISRFNPTVVFGSRAPGNFDFMRQIQEAVRYRANQMVRRTRAVVNGYAQDIRSGRNPQKRAAQSTNEPEPIIE